MVYQKISGLIYGNCKPTLINVAKMPAGMTLLRGNGVLFCWGKGRPAMGYITFSIVENQKEEFILYLHNHGTKKIHPQIRSKNLDEVIKKLKSCISYRTHFMNALSNFGPVANLYGEIAKNYPNWKDDVYPENWSDPLELYGCLKGALVDEGLDMDEELQFMQRLIDEKGAQQVWDSRFGVVAERVAESGRFF